ncbi:hypothetical protein ACFQ9X_40945 [Catenulispora yoronensis]
MGARPEPGPRPGVDQAAGLEASKEAWRRINKVIAERLQGKLPDPEELAGISALAEFGYARVPSVLFARSTLALVRVMQERAVEARALLVGTELEPAGARIRRSRSRCGRWRRPASTTPRRGGG